jgi:hypothetical protein
MGALQVKASNNVNAFSIPPHPSPVNDPPPADGRQTERQTEERQEVEEDLIAHGYVLQEARDAPDRPAKEFVFVARP